jgi:hypothetical protein
MIEPSRLTNGDHLAWQSFPADCVAGQKWFRPMPRTVSPDPARALARLAMRQKYPHISRPGLANRNYERLARFDNQD